LVWFGIRGVFRGATGAKPPLDQNLWISGAFQAPTGAEPPWKKRKNLVPPGQIPEYAPVWYTSEHIWFGTQLILRKEVRESNGTVNIIISDPRSTNKRVNCGTIYICF